MKKPTFTPIFGDVTPDKLTPPDALCIVSFTEKELNSSDAGRHRADTLVSSCQTAGKLGHGKVILSYAYDTDPREIYEIPEIVAHVKYLYDACPYLTYFMASDLAVVRPILLTLYGAKVLSTAGSTAQVGIPDVDQARKTSQQLQTAVKTYSESIGDRICWPETVNVIKSLGI